MKTRNDLGYGRLNVAKYRHLIMTSIYRSHSRSVTACFRVGTSLFSRLFPRTRLLDQTTMPRRVIRSIATSSVPVPSSFNLLPVELLHEIVDTCNDEEKGPLLAVLMATSRRLRNFALPLFFSNIHVTTPSLFNLLLDFLDDSPSEYYSYVRYVSSIRL